jgi:hypothetical protein
MKFSGDETHSCFYFFDIQDFIILTFFNGFMKPENPDEIYEKIILFQ